MKLLDLPKVIDKVSLSRTTIYRLIKTGDFPTPVKILGSSRWKESDLDRWMESLGQTHAEQSQGEPELQS